VKKWVHDQHEEERSQGTALLETIEHVNEDIVAAKEDRLCAHIAIEVGDDVAYPIWDSHMAKESEKKFLAD
jgi:hypothetical protein